MDWADIRKSLISLKSASDRLPVQPAEPTAVSGPEVIRRQCLRALSPRVRTDALGRWMGTHTHLAPSGQPNALTQPLNDVVRFPHHPRHDLRRRLIPAHRYPLTCPEREELCIARLDRGGADLAGERILRQVRRQRRSRHFTREAVGQPPRGPAGESARDHRRIAASALQRLPIWRARSRLRTPQERGPHRSEEHTSELQSPYDLVCRLLLEKKK